MDSKKSSIIEAFKNSPLKGVILLFVAVCILIIILAVLLFSAFSSQQNTFISTIPTPTPVQKINYQKAIINKTTENEFLEKNTIINKEHAAGGGIKYIIKSVDPLYPDEVIFKNGVAVFKRTSTQTMAPGGYPKIDTYKKQFGPPEEEIYGNKKFSPWISSFLYPTRGYVIIGNRVTGSIYEVQQFTPMTLSEYKQEYGNYIEKITPQGP